MGGTAHLTYKLHDIKTDSQSDTYPSTEADVAAFSWDVKLSGQCFDQQDGGIQVIFRTTPNQGPAYTETIESCQVPSRQMPGVIWPGLSAELYRGVHDLRQENTKPANSSGDYYSVIHVEAAR